mgnify:CR=1 FL=1
MKKGVISVNSNAEKTIIAMTISVVIFDGKKKKPAKRKSFAQRVSKHYKTIDNIMLMTVAKDVKKKEQERAALKKKNSYKTKLRDLEIQDAEFIEL